MSSKVCGKCKQANPLEPFGKHSARKDGLQPWCKVCIKEYNKKYYQENCEKRLEYAKQYYEENYEELREYMKQYHQKNRRKRSEYSKQYFQDNPEKFAVYRTKRDALKRDSIPETLLNCPIEKDRLEKTYKLRDLLTKATGVQYHVDHIWPLSKGGPHWSGNLQVITAEENLSKSASFCEDTARVIQESLDDYIQSIRH